MRPSRVGCEVLLSRLKFRLLRLHVLIPSRPDQTRPDQRNHHNTTHDNKTKATFQRQDSLVIGIFCDRRPSQTDPSPQTCLASCSLPRPRPVRSAHHQTASPHRYSCSASARLSTRYTHANAAAATTLRQASPRRRTTEPPPPSIAAALSSPCLAAYLDVWTSQPPMLQPAIA